MPTQEELDALAKVKAAEAAAKEAEGDPKEKDPAAKKKVSWEDWLEEQPDEVKANYEEHVGGLKSALSSERTKARTASKLEKELKQFKDAEKAAEDKEKTDLEKLQDKYSALEGFHSKLESQLAEEKLKQAITSESAKLKFTDPEDAFIFLDLKKVEQDDEGNYENIPDLLKELAKAKPYLIGDGSGGHGTSNREDLKRKTDKAAVAKPKIKF